MEVVIICSRSNGVT